jgi:prepilin-type N-terminal cleavage/methylation domain-containing protein
MKKLMRNKKTEKGFTLLEVIVTLTLAAVLASFLVSFMGTTITKSSDPIKQARDLGQSSGSMETISAAYASYLSGGVTWDAFKTAYGSYTTVASGSDIYSSNFETIQMSITTGNQQIVSYFMQ